MSRTIEIVDHEYERKIRRQRKALLFAVLVSFCLFGYPVAKDYSSQWMSLRSARKLGLYLSMLKTRAILTKTPLEARFKRPDMIEVLEVESCGPGAKAKKLWDAKLSDFASDVQFAAEGWVREYVGSKDPILQRFCYDPLFGSSVHADGLVHGAVFLVHRLDTESGRGDHYVQLNVEGPSGDVTLE